MHKYRNGQYNGFETAAEILSAIEEIGGDDIRNENSNSYRIWDDPTPAEKAAIVKIAFGLADPDESVLFWGVGSIKRPL